MKNVSSLKNVYTEQLHKLQHKHQHECELLEDMRLFTKQRCIMEKEYAQSLSKLAQQFIVKRPPLPPPSLSSQDGNKEQRTMHEVWQTLLEETDKVGKTRLQAADIYSQQISESCKVVRGLKVHVAKKVFENLIEVQKDLSMGIQELVKLQKAYKEEEHVAHDARVKSNEAEEKVKKKSVGLFTSFSKLQQQSAKLNSRKEACESKSTAARNEYLLSLASINAQLHRYYNKDAPELIKAMDGEIYEKMQEYFTAFCQAELHSCGATQECFMRILADSTKVNRDFQLRGFLIDNPIFTDLIQYQFQPQDNDVVSRVSVAFQNSSVVEAEARRCACKVVQAEREARVVARKLLKAQEVALTDQSAETSEPHVKVEEMKQAMRKSQIERVRMEARLEAIRTTGMNTEAFILSAKAESQTPEDEEETLPTSGGVAATAGGVTATVGGVAATAGGVAATAGGVAVIAGGVAATAGNEAVTAGGVAINGGNFTANRGNVTANGGNVTANGGNVTANGGNITANGGNITANGGSVARSGSGDEYKSQETSPVKRNSGAETPTSNRNSTSNNVAAFDNNVVVVDELQQDPFSNGWHVEEQTQDETVLGQNNSSSLDNDTQQRCDVVVVEEIGQSSLALFSFQGTGLNELDLVEGDLLETLGGVEDGWIRARDSSGKIGLVPAAYVQIGCTTPPPQHLDPSVNNVETYGDPWNEMNGSVKQESLDLNNYTTTQETTTQETTTQQATTTQQTTTTSNDNCHIELDDLDLEVEDVLTQPLPMPTSDKVWARALYDYYATNDEELTFNEGQLIQVIRKELHGGVDDGWWEGEVNGRVGVFPSLVVAEEGPDGVVEEEEEEEEEVQVVENHPSLSRPGPPHFTPPIPDSHLIQNNHPPHLPDVSPEATEVPPEATEPEEMPDGLPSAFGCPPSPPLEQAPQLEITIPTPTEGGMTTSELLQAHSLACTG